MTFHSFFSLTVTLFRVFILGHIVGHSFFGFEPNVAFYFLCMHGLHWQGKLEWTCQSNVHHRQSFNFAET